jgi:hypothetical protein
MSGVIIALFAIWMGEQTQASPPLFAARVIRLQHAQIVLHPLEAVDQAATTTRVRLTIRPAPGRYIYAPDGRGSRGLSLVFESAIPKGRLQWPPSEPYVFEPTGERFHVYRHPFELTQTVTRPQGTSSTSATPSLRAKLVVQACDERVCYRPEEVRLTW